MPILMPLCYFFLQDLKPDAMVMDTKRTKVDFGMKYLHPMDPGFKTSPRRVVMVDRSEPGTLMTMAAISDYIVIGKFEGVLRYAYSPFSEFHFEGQNTLFAFKTERYLKGDGGAKLKIYYNGGPLPWRHGEQFYVGSIQEDDPIPSIGDRYILFLRKPDTRFPVSRQMGYVSVIHKGKREITQYLDELDFTTAMKGKVLLRNGQALSADLSGGQKFLHWRFMGGSQIIDVSEKEAIENIKAAIGL